MMHFASCLNRFSDVRILVIGDMMLDIFMYGMVERISPEAPVPIFKFGHKKEMLGGAGNVAANLASLGCQTTCIGLVGDDTEAEQLSQILDEKDCRGILLPLADHQTTVKTRMIASHKHILRADHEILTPDIQPILTQFREIVEQEIVNADIVLLSDYAKGFLTSETAQMVIEAGKRHGKPVIVDPKGRDYSKYNGAMLVKPNLKEFHDVTGIVLNPKSDRFHDDVSRGAKILFDKYRLSNLIVTLSEHGMLCISAKEPSKVVQIPTEAHEVFDVSGAGDTAFAVLGAALGTGARIEQALTLANTASGIVVGKLGTSCVTTQEIANRLNQKNVTSQTDNIIPVSQIASILAPLRQQKKTIGFTNGCFDCMHMGHLNSFARARAECDVLIVGVNSDRSVKSYKGPDRPIQDERTRATLVASLKYVDYVVVFEETTAENLIDLIRPDVVAKEGYSIDQWPEARQVIAYGGRAVILERVEGYSTTDFIAKAKKAA